LPNWQSASHAAQASGVAPNPMHMALLQQQNYGMMAQGNGMMPQNVQHNPMMMQMLQQMMIMQQQQQQQQQQAGYESEGSATPSGRSYDSHGYLDEPNGDAGTLGGMRLSDKMTVIRDRLGIDDSVPVASVLEEAHERFHTDAYGTEHERADAVLAAIMHDATSEKSAASDATPTATPEGSTAPRAARHAVPPAAASSAEPSAAAAGASAAATAEPRLVAAGPPGIPRGKFELYRKAFLNHEVSPGEGLARGQVKHLLAKFELGDEAWYKIWKLADHDDDGVLALGEFAVACHLARLHRKGEPLPADVRPLPSTP